MGRSGYSDDCADNWQIIKWRGMVASAVRGKRGQSFFADMLAALDAMPEKRLIANELAEPRFIDCGHWGLIRGIDEVCALGALGCAREIDMTTIDPEDNEKIAGTFNIATCLAQEVAFMNDDCWRYETPDSRWQRMRMWVAQQIKPDREPAKEEERTDG